MWGCLSSGGLISLKTTGSQGTAEGTPFSPALLELCVALHPSVLHCSGCPLDRVNQAPAEPCCVMATGGAGCVCVCMPVCAAHFLLGHHGLVTLVSSLARHGYLFSRPAGLWAHSLFTI